MPQSFLILCLLGGLLFSCSEGVRLLPFPAVPNSAPTDLAWNFKSQTNYLENLHRFESRQTNSQTKSQPDHWLNNSKTAFRVRSFQSAGFALSREFGDSTVFQSVHFIGNSFGRAPPRL